MRVVLVLVGYLLGFFFPPFLPFLPFPLAPPLPGLSSGLSTVAFTPPRFGELFLDVLFLVAISILL